MADGGGSEVSYYLARQKQMFGPVTLSLLNEYIRTGEVTARDWIFLADPGEWFPVLEIPQLAALFYSVDDKPDQVPPMQAPPKTVAATGTMAHVESQQIEFAGQVFEKRRWVRLSTDLPIRFNVHQPFSDNIDVRDAVTVDISEGGVGFAWDEPLEPGSLYDVEIHLFPEVFRSQCRVMSSRQTEDGRYHIGMSYLNLKEPERRRLLEYLQSLTL